MNPNAGGWERCGASANEYSCAHGAQINIGDLTPYLTYRCNAPAKYWCFDHTGHLGGFGFPVNPFLSAFQLSDRSGNSGRPSHSGCPVVQVIPGQPNITVLLMVLRKMCMMPVVLEFACKLWCTTERKRNYVLYKMAAKLKFKRMSSYHYLASPSLQPTLIFSSSYCTVLDPSIILVP